MTGDIWHFKADVAFPDSRSPFPAVWFGFRFAFGFNRCNLLQRKTMHKKVSRSKVVGGAGEWLWLELVRACGK